jgi:ribulose-5-phosphate 4-epimerase/fuculose-1-phosphate aldolase
LSQDNGVGSASQAEDLVLANRIVARAGLATAFGHVSVRLGPDRFAIPTRASPALASPQSLLTMDLEGAVVEGEGLPNAEFWIHARTYAARPDVGAVVHVHPPHCVVLGQIGSRFRPLHNSGALLGMDVPLYRRPGLIRTRELGEQVAEALGSRTALLLRGHGANVVAAGLHEAVVLACFLDEAAQLQGLALAAAGGDGRAVEWFTAEEADRAAEDIGSTGPIERAWDYYAALAEGRG